MSKVRTDTILKAIGCEQLSLSRGERYWYFVYDDFSNNIHHTKTVRVRHLNSLPFERWVRDGKYFLVDVYEEYDIVVEAPAPELEPCPFCGSEAKYNHKRGSNYGNTAIICCTSCSASVKKKTELDNGRGFDLMVAWLADEWNRRA